MNETILILELIHVHTDHVIFSNLGLAALRADELINGDAAFRLVSDVDHDEVLGHHDNGALNNLPFLDGLRLLMLSEKQPKFVQFIDVVGAYVVLVHVEKDPLPLFFCRLPTAFVPEP